MSEPPVPPSTSILVSGGSRGLGLAMVSYLLDHGCRVATFSRSRTSELEQLEDQYGDQLVTGALNVNDADAVKAFVRSASQQFDGLDGLVNNAAVGQDSLLVHTSPDRVDQIVSTNLTAPLLLTRAFLRQLLARSARGRIVMVTSICAQRGYSGLVAYAATKGGMEAAVRTLAREMHGRALVNAIAPGFFASEMSSVLGTEQLDTIVRRTPSGRLVEPADILPVLDALLLTSSNVNGQVLSVDGGASV